MHNYLSVKTGGVCMYVCVRMFVWFFPGETAKRRFKNLRDQFRIELRKVPVGKGGDLPLDEYLSTWPWFKHMFFLKDQMKACVGTSTASGVGSNKGKRKCEYQQEPKETNNSYEEAPTNSTMKEQYVPMTYAKKLKASTLELQSDLIAIEKQRLELQKQRCDEEKDPDRMFLLSLLNSIKTLQPRRAHVFRIKVQQLLYEAQYADVFNVPTTAKVKKWINYILYCIYSSI